MNYLVTGSSSGIGESVARKLVENGHSVVLFARRADLLDTLTESLNATYDTVRAVAVAGDVGQWADCVRAVDGGFEIFGRLDGLVNAAGDWVDDPLAEAEVADIQRFIQTDVVGATLITRAILPVLKAHKAGRIVHINGLQAFIRQRPPVLYATVESAVRGLCESLRWEAAEYGVHVGCITLGSVANTEADHPEPSILMTDGRRKCLSRSEVARAVLFMLSQPDGVNVDEIILTPLGQKF
ncbi:MAG TPA: hypothetical protein DIT99_16500 [Candidatus Latescibacteria bacterium]|nr:hypothetical protein [Candidatus Latescibacterota bacterium]